MPRTRRLGLLIAALSLIAIGVIGASLTGLVLTATVTDERGAPRRLDRDEGQRDYRRFGDFSSSGERIYFTGVGSGGPIRVEWTPSGGFGGMMGRGYRGPAQMGCVSCHGADGRGRTLGMMFSIRSSDIRYETLTSRHVDEDGSTSPGWTENDIARAIREGVEPDGEDLDPAMPRWDMNDADMEDTIEYLKELR